MMDKQPLLIPEVSISLWHPLLSLGWEKFPQLPWTMNRAKSVWYDGRVHVGGGVVEAESKREAATLLSIDESGQWTIMETPTRFYGLTIYHGNLVLVGGIEYPSDRDSNKVWQLQSREEDGKEEWKEDAIPPMPTKRFGVSAVGYHELLLVAGGRDSETYLDTVELYNSKRRQWLSMTQLPRPCFYMSSTVVGSHIVFAGGDLQGREVYHCSIDDIISSRLQWERLADAPNEYTSITTVKGVLLAIGGLGTGAAMFAFSSHTRRWHGFFVDLPLSISHTCTAVIPTGIVTIGGKIDSGQRSARVFKLDISDEGALRFFNIILKGVQSGLLSSVERALTAVKEHFHSSQPVDGSLLLDFLAHSSSPNVHVSSIEHSCSPLMIACANGDTKMVDVLLENGASPSYKNKDDVTAVHVACSKDNLKLVQRLVDSNGGLTQQATTNLLQMTDEEGQTVLHYACSASTGNETLKWLLNHNKALCDMLNQRTNTGLTPLLTACHHGNEAAVELLVNHEHVDTAVYDENDQGALHLAAQHDSPVVVELLLKKGCPSDAQDSEGNTALHIAHKKSSSSVITILTDVDNGRVELIMNEAGQFPADIDPDEIIPPEIKKKGPEAVQLYLEALMEGKTKIPRCNLVILGQERVGKTSLYRLLVLKGFDPEQDSTRGIDNAIVEALDRRNVTAEDWSEKDDQMVRKHADQQFVRGVIGALPSDLLPQGEIQTHSTTESELNEEVSKLKLSLVSMTSSASATQVQGRKQNNLPRDAAAPPVDPSHFILWPSQQPQMKDTTGSYKDEFTILSPSQSEDEQSQMKDTAGSYTENEFTILSPSQSEDEQSQMKDTAGSYTENEFTILSPSQSEDEQPQMKDTAGSTRQDSTNRSMLSKLKQFFKVHLFRSLSPAHPENENASNEKPNSVFRLNLSSRQTLLINEELMAGTAMKKVDPVLLLNVLDFAGQKEYRPMHHCFLTRRAVYLMVFNLQQVILFLEQKESSNAMTINPFEEIRYWLHSVHIHTLPTVSGNEIMSVKNVCLVGTHRDSPDGPNKRKRIEDEKLQEINDLITKEMEGDDRCLNHLHVMGPDHDRVFLAVENSIDGREEQYREASGAKALQREVKVMTDRLPFINEDFPVSWLNLEAKLVEWRKNLETEKSSLLVQLDQVLKLAAQCGIRGREGQLLALEFFHETGKIVYLKLLPHLFITDAQHAELEDLVVLDPTWLIRVMQNVVELNYRSSIKGKDVKQLHKTGVASSVLLKEAWSGYLREPKEKSFHQFCLMLQAECLIHPVKINSQSLELQASSSPTTRSEAVSTTDEEQLYLVPGKLPDKIEEEPIECSRWIKFYFDFQKFLPDELYHRLICLLLAELQRHQSIDRPYLAKRICQFRSVHGCHWSVEFEKAQHRLKISVLSRSTDPREPTDYINVIHNNYLQRICTLSNLEGLRYVGGPLLDPCARCGKTGIIRCTYYFKGEDRPSESECPICLQSYDVSKLLSSQPQAEARHQLAGSIHNAMTKAAPRDKPLKSPSPPSQTDCSTEVQEYKQAEHLQGTVSDTSSLAASKTAPHDQGETPGPSPLLPPHGPTSGQLQTQEQPLTVLNEQLDVEVAAQSSSGVSCIQQQVSKATERSLPPSTPPLNARTLTIIKWRNDEGSIERFNVISSVSYKWREIGKVLGIGFGLLESISKKHQKDPEPCCDEVLNKWLEGSQGSEHYPITWDGLIELLKDAGLSYESEKLSDIVALPLITHAPVS